MALNIQKIKQQLQQKPNAVEEMMPQIQDPNGEPAEKEEEDHNWHNPEYQNVIDYEFGDDGNGHAEAILDSLKQEDIDYKSKKSMSQFREFFYDLVKTYERFENNQY